MENYDPNSAALIGALIAACVIPALIVWIISAIGQWKVYEKAGKPGWAALIPIYNAIVLLEIVGKPVWWLFLFLIPCVNIVFLIWTMNLLSKSFGQSEGFTIGLIIVPFIFFPILVFVNYRYLGPAGLGAAGYRPFDPGANYQDPFPPNNPQQV